jgi:tetratricopeptide (TPR) repeat protein
VVQKAEAYLQRWDIKGNVDKALALVEDALKGDGSNAALYALKAEACVRKIELGPERKLWEERALEAGRRAVKLNGELAAGHIALGLALHAAKNNDEAVQEFERARHLNPISGAAHLGLARVKNDQKETEEAERLFRQAVSFSPGDWRPIYSLGGCLYKQGRYEEALEEWGKAQVLAPNNTQILMNRAPGHHMLGQFGEAADLLQRALTLDGTSGRTWANLGTAYYFQGRYEDSAEALNKATKLMPEMSKYWGNLGDAYRRVDGAQSKAWKAYEKAIELVRRELKAAPNDGLRSSLASYLAKSGDAAGAKSELAQLGKGKQSDTGTLMKAAIAHELTGNRKEALEYLGMAIRDGHSMHEITREPELAGLRADPNYARIAGSKMAGSKKGGGGGNR